MTDQMNIAVRLVRMGVELCPHSSSCKMAVVSWFHRHWGVKDWVDRYWLTLGKTIFHPDHITNPESHVVILDHELAHVKQQEETWLWLWVAKYLASWKFRYEMEREAFLTNIHNGEITVEQAATALMLPPYSAQLSEGEIASWLEAHL